MSTLFETQERLDRNDRPDTEFTLSTASLLGIFFGLVLVCGVFFGFGYSIGRRSGDAKGSADTRAEGRTANATNAVANQNALPMRPKPAASQDLPSENTAAEPFTSSRESLAGQSRIPSAQAHDAEAPPARTATRTANATPAPEPAANTPYKASPARVSPARRPVFEPAAASPIRTAASGPSPSAAMTPPALSASSLAAQPTVVQIAAVSHQEDAEVLIAALKKRGYNVAIRREPQDQLMHVQVGPFPSRAEAVAMRQRLLADGYNAIVKP